MKFNKTSITAGVLLGIMGILALLSMKQDALTFDELAHIPAGYSYLTQQDYRVNPEHPPLAKDISAFPLLFLNLNFPTESPWWQQEDPPAWWVQFNLGTEFLYESGNDPRQIIFWSRVPMILLLLLCGWMLFCWTRKIAGDKAALAALFLFSFSPTLLAHGRLVTTDVPAALGAVLAIIAWVSFLKNPTSKNVLLAGFALGIALLLKFSMILLIPSLGILTILHILLSNQWRETAKYVSFSVAAGFVALFLVIWPVYQFHIWNYPQERQTRDTIADLSPGEITASEQAAIWMSDKPLLRPIAQYARGALMASQRSSFGNTTYFMGEVFSGGKLSYFPTMYLTKIPLALHVLTLLLLLLALLRFRSMIRNIPLDIWGAVIFISIYWAVTLSGNLNIGVRHILPVLPFTYLLIAWAGNRLFPFFEGMRARILFFGGATLLFSWYAFSSLSAFPHFISFYNESAGGTRSGHEVAVDSNYDWGQDFYRLLEKVEEHNIEKLRLHYFGGESPSYWLGEKYLEMNCSDQREEKQRTCKEAQEEGGWIAISLNELKGGSSKQAPGYDQDTTYYGWLSAHEPVDQAGTSILLYEIK
ncbi:MAG: glycosyltransferase family 39 protein [Candidatus Yanofskybacteria bacterium]|nr:glycosyltransferase family 39 protein [Candidatus Yanofskybacteria bacterium]